MAPDLKINLASAHSLLFLQNPLDQIVSNPFDLEHLDTKRYGFTGFESQPKSNAAIQLAKLLSLNSGFRFRFQKRLLESKKSQPDYGRIHFIAIYPRFTRANFDESKEFCNKNCDLQPISCEIGTSEPRSFILIQD